MPICGDDAGLNVDGELFVACNECAFPSCRTCYEYEQSEGSQVCPQCKIRFNRHKGCTRVAGDEDEDNIDDLENEFSFAGRDQQDVYHTSDNMVLVAMVLMDQRKSHRRIFFCFLF